MKIEERKSGLHFQVESFLKKAFHSRQGHLNSNGIVFKEKYFKNISISIFFYQKNKITRRDNTDF